MNLRSKLILEAAIKEYIRDGKPVSSKELAKRYDFGIKDATVRVELNRLVRGGFLAQLHTSGGRVPTDKGYQLFVSETADNALTSTKILNQDRFGKLADGLKKGALRDFIDEFAGETKLLGVGQKEKEIYKSGLDELFERLDLETKEEFNEIIRDFEMLDERLRKMREKLFGDFPLPRVFIGRQSPITRSENLSVIVDNYDVGGEQVLIAIIGPKRMDYGRNLKIFGSLRNYFE
jgi:transcriptional regulator of heat shock response